jgi:hypothetical protein
MSIAGISALVSGGIQVGSAIYDAAQRRKRISDLSRRRFATTEYGKELMRISRTGDLSAADEAAIRSRTSRATAQSAQDARQAYIRQAVGAGVDPNSIAAARGLNEIEIARSGVLADQETDIALSESAARRQARKEYAMQATNYDLQNQAAIDELRYGSSAQTAGAIASGIGMAAAGADRLSLESNLNRVTTRFEELENIKSSRELTSEEQLEYDRMATEIMAYRERLYGNTSKK